MAISLDEPVLPETGATLRQLAAAGELRLTRSGCYRPHPDAPARPAWWAITVAEERSYEISGPDFRALRRLRVPEIRRSQSASTISTS
ncbi:MAG TPA: hypothetical protein VM689_19470 [Aliidongia sp.]|nr:hypothetical protein [Aliidongia sp.]